MDPLLRSECVESLEFKARFNNQAAPPGRLVL